MSNEQNGSRELLVRTKAFALRIIRLYAALPKTSVAQVLGKQALRSGTSVGAQYREGRRARSNAEFVSKMESAIQELDETCYWLDPIVESELVAEKRLGNLREEATHLTAMLVASVKTVKSRR